MTGFEPATPWSQIKCTTKLCYIPIIKLLFQEAWSLKMARPVGIEPATFWSVVKRSIQLSYGRIYLGLVGAEGLEPSRYCYRRILSPTRLPFRHAPVQFGGSCQIRTGDHRVAVYCLTTWLRNRVSLLPVYYIKICKKMQHPFLILFMFLNKN